MYQKRAQSDWQVACLAVRTVKWASKEV